MSNETMEEIDRLINEAIADCPMCVESMRDRTMCLSAYDGYQCTRKRGHEGMHCACGGMRHPMVQWPNL